MKFIILSDIHGNIHALNACLNQIDKMNFDAIIWCGDYITDFFNSHEVIQKIQEYSKKYKSYIIAGNREKYIIEYEKRKESCNNEFSTAEENIRYTYELLTKKDLEWIKTLPDCLEINYNKKKIYVSHKCTYEKIQDCNYKIFGHSHKQYNFRRDNVRYINPGSIGISTDEIIGAQFSVLELNDDYEKIEEYQINYDIKVPIEELKQTALYNEGVKWGQLLVKELETGIDYPQICLKEYNRIKQEHHIKEESMEIWNVALNNIINS
ncbi:MAG: metallophosphoesterase family protein [Clostridia bacterium]|nr:metallophosphoesterase family protein [Clostridia bacterium]